MTTPLLVVAIVVAGIWAALAAAVFRNSLKIRFLRPVEGPIPEDAPTVEAIIPALNEEDRLAGTVEKVLAQEYPHLRLTVINDRSTDRTGAILDELAKARPIRAIHGAPRPYGWVGKTWAVAQGARGATADWLLFVDADIGLHPRALASAMKQAEDSGADLVSIIARPEIETFWQAAIAQALGLVLFTMYPLHKANDPKSKVAIAAGGFLLVRRSLYESIGGHGAVRAEIVEDLKLADAIKRVGGRTSTHLAPDLAWTHMFGTFGDLWRGLRKNAYAGMEYQPRKFITGLLGGLVMAWTPPVATIAGAALGSWPVAVAGAVGWLGQVAATLPSVPYLRINPLLALAMPSGATAYSLIACSSVWNHYRGRIIWKGVEFSSSEVREASRPGRGPGGGAEGVAAGPAPAPPRASGPPD